MGCSVQGRHCAQARLLLCLPCWLFLRWRDVLNAVEGGGFAFVLQKKGACSRSPFHFNQGCEREQGADIGAWYGSRGGEKACPASPALTEQRSNITRSERITEARGESTTQDSDPYTRQRDTNLKSAPEKIIVGITKQTDLLDISSPVASGWPRFSLHKGFEIWSNSAALLPKLECTAPSFASALKICVAFRQRHKHLLSVIINHCYRLSLSLVTFCCHRCQTVGTWGLLMQRTEIWRGMYTSLCSWASLSKPLTFLDFNEIFGLNWEHLRRVSSTGLSWPNHLDIGAL